MASIDRERFTRLWSEETEFFISQRPQLDGSPGESRFAQARWRPGALNG